MKKVLIFGGSGLVGSKFIELNSSLFEIKSPSANEVDILNKDKISKIVEEFEPDSIINFAAYTQVEEAENQNNEKGGICFQINVNGANNVARATQEFNKHLIHISTDYVFDGNKSIASYVEADKPNPINWYGQTKLRGETAVLESGSKAVIVRISMPYASHYQAKLDVARFFWEQLKIGKPIRAVEDQRITPTLVNDIANALKLLLEGNAQGFYHVASRGSVTPLEFAKTISEEFGFNYSLISEITLDEFNKNKKAKLLKYSWLNPAKFEKEFGDDILHTVEEGLVIFKQEIDQRS